LSELGILLQTLDAYDSVTFDKGRPQIEKTLYTQYGLRPEVANEILNKIR